jgi:hypothetical protein
MDTGDFGQDDYNIEISGEKSNSADIFAAHTKTLFMQVKSEPDFAGQNVIQITSAADLEALEWRTLHPKSLNGKSVICAKITRDNTPGVVEYRIKAVDRNKTRVLTILELNYSPFVGNEVERIISVGDARTSLINLDGVDYETSMNYAIGYKMGQFKPDIDAIYWVKIRNNGEQKALYRVSGSAEVFCHIIQETADDLNHEANDHDIEIFNMAMELSDLGKPDGSIYGMLLDERVNDHLSLN